jgi:hypothetical protein
VLVLDGMMNVSRLARRRSSIVSHNQQLKALPSMQTESLRKCNIFASVTIVLTQNGCGVVVLGFVKSAIGRATSSLWYACSVGSGLAVAACRTDCDRGHYNCFDFF